MSLSKKFKHYLVNYLEYLLNKSNISKKSLGIMVRSYHFYAPLLMMLAVLIPDKIYADISVIFYFLALFLFFLFQGCFISTLENRLCEDDFNIVDPLLEFTNQKINNHTRMVISYFILVCYSGVFFGIYYMRFWYNKQLFTN